MLDTNQPVKLQPLANVLKSVIHKLEIVHQLGNKKKQVLISLCCSAADLHLFLYAQQKKNVFFQLDPNLLVFAMLVMNLLNKDL